MPGTRLAARLRPLALGLLLALAAGGCGSGHRATIPPVSLTELDGNELTPAVYELSVSGDELVVERLPLHGRLTTVRRVKLTGPAASRFATGRA
jgi:hypothetical protein